MSTIQLDLNDILTCLQNTYMSPDKNTRMKSEEKLLIGFNENLIDFITNLMNILKQQNDKNIRLSIILFLRRNLSKKIENNLISKDNMNSLIQMYLLIMVEQNISNKELDNLKDTFIILLTNVSAQILIEILEYIKKQITSLSLGSINGIIFILSAIINSAYKNTKDLNIFISIYNSIMILASDILQNLYNKYSDIDISKIDTNDYMKFNGMFYNIFELFFDSNLKLKKKSGEGFKIDQDILKILDRVYNIGIKLLVNLKSSDNNRLISWTGQKNIDKNINIMKVNIFKFINLRINEMNEFNVDDLAKENHNQMIKIVMLNLEWIIMNKYSYFIKIETADMNMEYPDYNYTLLLTFIFIYLKRILTKKIFIKDYTSQFNSMYNNILLPLLISTDIEEESALNNETINDYIIDMNDIIYENKNKKIKSQIAAIIKKFYTKNPDCNNHMMKYTINLIYFLFEETQNLCDKNLLNENDIIILLINAYSKEKVISALFLALNIIHDCENKKNKLENYDLIDNLYRTVFSIFEKNQNIYPLLIYQFIIFMRNNLYQFYYDDILILEKAIKYLFEALFNINCALISNSAGYTIQKFFEICAMEDETAKKNGEGEENKKSTNIRNILIRITRNISDKFEKQILGIQIPNFFDVLSQIIMSFEKTENNFFKNIFSNLCYRINLEAEKISQIKFVVQKDSKKNKNNKEKNNITNQEIIINKCFNIIKLLLNNKIFVFNNYDFIENSLRPLLVYMENPEKIKFDEDIIYIIYILMKNREKVIGLGFNLIKNIYKYIDKCGSLFFEVYQLIDKYMAYGTNQILTNKVWYEGIFKALMSGIKGDKYNKGILYTCMLIQAWIMNCANLPQENLNILIEEIIKNINVILDEYIKTKDMKKYIYNFLGYVTTIFSGLINYEKLVLPILYKYNNEKVLKNWLKIIISENEASFEYEIKILIYSICSIVKKGLIEKEIYYLNYLGLDLLKCQTYNSNYLLNKNSRKININFIDDDDEDKQQEEEEDEEEEIDIELKEIKMIIDATSNPIKNIDEFHTFSEMLKYLKNNNNILYMKWENSLSQEQKEKILKLISTKRINIHINGQDNVNVARRIVSIKRNNNHIMNA